MHKQANNLSPELRLVGHELNSVETAIHQAKQNILEVLASEPVDELALNSIRAHLHETRLIRNGLREELDILKSGERHYSRYRWTV